MYVLLCFGALVSIYLLFRNRKENKYTKKLLHLGKNENSQRIVASDGHVLMIDEHGGVWGSGKNYNAELGLGHKISSITRLTKIESLRKIHSVAAGSSHSLFLDCFGCVYATGDNRVGQLALGDTKNRLTPALIKLPQCQAIAAGDLHSLFLTTEGIVFSCGGNESGELGLGTRKIKCLSPNKIKELPEIIALSCGYFHSLLLDIQGHVWSFGCNFRGQLGLGDFVDRFFPVRLESCSSRTGTNEIYLMDVKNPLQVKSIFAGANSSFFIDIYDEIWAFGTNNTFQLGKFDTPQVFNIELPEKLSIGFGHIKTIIPAAKCTFFITLEGDVWQAGFDSFAFKSPTEVPATCFQQLILPKIIHASHRADYAFFEDESGAVWSIGINVYGQLGLGDHYSRKTLQLVDNFKLGEQFSFGVSPKSARKL